MATREYLEDRINSLNDKIAKSENIIKKKTALISKREKELASLITSRDFHIANCEICEKENNEIYWKECDIRYLEEDIAQHQKKIEKEYKPALVKYNDELNKVLVIKRDVPAIVEFLNQWKEKCTKYYIELKDSDYRKELRAKRKEADEKAYNWRYDSWKKINNGEITKEEDAKVQKELNKESDQLREEYNRIFGVILTIESRARDKNSTFKVELEKLLKQEWDNKYDKIVADCKEKIGNITDASNLSISNRGELNGLVIGDKGKATVNTISAGGWNIQCFHFRCLIHKVL